MRKAFCSALVLSFLFVHSNAQVGIGTTTPDPAAMLDVNSTTKGMLIPRVALTGVNDVTTIPSAPPSLIIYNTATAGSGATAVIPGYYYWNGTAWLHLTTYTLQQNINTNSKFLSGDGTNTGIFLADNGNMVASGVFGAGSALPAADEGAKLIWYPKKAALFAGYASSTVPWSDASVGDFSAVFGSGTSATGNGSFSTGLESEAAGNYSVAMGLWNMASGHNSVAMGTGSTADGYSSVALGGVSVANGIGAVAIGRFNEASGNYSTALGNFVSTNMHEGAFIIGDNSVSSLSSSNMPNQMSMRFANGYVLATSTMALRMSGGGTIVSDGVFGSTDVLTATGSGSRMIWYPKKAAFRAGFAESASWDDANIGFYSVAFGRGCTANGSNSTSFGEIATAAGETSTSIGANTTASGINAIAMGIHSTAAGNYSTAIGYFPQANGDFSVAIGQHAIANNLSSFAFGSYTEAMAINSTAMGGFVTVVNGHHGSFMIGDGTAPVVNTESSKGNEMTMRFANGYRLFSDADATIGVKIDPGGNAWSTISDARLKENFAVIDGEEFLKRIGTIPDATTWNYKGQNPKQYRHYGPMAQDFYTAFGTDEYGAIGNDTAINQADFNGVNFTAIQALVKRTTKLQQENEQYIDKIGQLEKQIENLTRLMMQIQEEKK